jgi:hypothetical protein
MLRSIKLWLAIAALGLASPAQAMTFQLGVDVTFAAGSNPIGAVVGTTPNAGTADIGSQTVTGVGSEFPSLNPAFDAGASLALTIGNILFEDDDDIEASLYSDIPGMLFQNGGFQGLDFVVLFEISGTSAIGKVFDSTDLGQDTSAFTSTQHYWADFFDDGSFLIGTVTGFDVFSDGEGDLGPIIGEVLVEGNVFVPEPSPAVLACAALAGLALVRRR